MSVGRGGRFEPVGVALIVLVAVVSTLVAAPPATAKSPPDRGTAFEPRSFSRPLYGTKPPWEDPERQRHYVEAHDGVDLYVETWLPAAKGGNVPPRRVPVILVMTPYVAEGEEEYPDLIRYFTRRGYAVAQHHVRGNEESGGCMAQTQKDQIDGAARIIEYLGRDAPWSDGNVGSYGISYDGETQTSVAGLGNPKRTKYLKAIVPVAAIGGLYEWSYADGVPFDNSFRNHGYWQSSLLPGNRVEPWHTPERFSCGDEEIQASINPEGNYGPYWRAHELRPGAPKVKAATLYVHGLRDFNVLPIALAGWFSELPATTPHKGLFPVMGHSFPNWHAWVEPDWERADWFGMVAAWFDRYLKGLPTGVERWPAVQVQDSTGQWRASDEFPFIGGPPAHLALSADGALGDSRPRGSTTYLEQVHLGPASPSQNAIFETPRVKAPLHLSGMPILDLWVQLDRPDAHIAAKLEVIGRDGEVIVHEEDSFFPVDISQAPAGTFGARSLQHLEPMKRGWFEQEQPVAPTPGETLHVNVRLYPTDLVVPVGGRLRLTLAGSATFDTAFGLRRWLPSGSASAVTILHDCNYPSSLRFLLPDPADPLLNVREKDERKKELRSTPRSIGIQDGAGLATQRVCGAGPVRPSLLRDGTER